MGNGFFPSAQARPTTAIEVLNAVVAKIRSNISQLSTETVCYITDTPDPPSIEINDNIFCTVCFLGGPCDQPLGDGGGNLTISQLGTIETTVYSRVESDQLERYTTGTTDSIRGLLSLLPKMLQTLGGKNLDGGVYNGNQSWLLHDGMYPSRTSHPRNKQFDGLAQFGIPWEVKFTWQLDTDSKFS